MTHEEDQYVPKTCICGRAMPYREQVRIRYLPLPLLIKPLSGAVLKLQDNAIFPRSSGPYDLMLKKQTVFNSSTIPIKE